MGVKGFSKAFESKVITLKKLKNTIIAIDASVLLYKAALGAASISTLTDSNNNPTMHINVILAKILNFAVCDIGQIWVFDFHENGYQPPDKALELASRKKKRESAEKILKDLKKEKKEESSIKNKQDDLFSSDEDEDENENKSQTILSDLDNKICQKEKECFSMSTQIVNDCKFMLDCLDITWTTAPKGIEAEHVCAELTNTDELDFACDAVFSTDIDALIYGSKQLVREISIKKKKVLQLYNLNDILCDNKINMKDLTKIAVILGTDHAKKTSGIGPKTVLKKYQTVELSDEQNSAVQVFKKHIDVEKLKFSNEFGDYVIQNKKKMDLLIDWLVNIKSFNKDKLIKRINKVNTDYKY